MVRDIIFVFSFLDLIFFLGIFRFFKIFSLLDVELLIFISGRKLLFLNFLMEILLLYLVRIVFKWFIIVMLVEEESKSKSKFVVKFSNKFFSLNMFILNILLLLFFILLFWLLNCVIFTFMYGCAFVFWLFFVFFIFEVDRLRRLSKREKFVS